MKDRIRVLIVDDEAPIVNSLRNMLILDRENEFVVNHESAPERVIAAVKSFQPHVVILDNFFAQKEMGIDDLLPRIAGQFPDVKVIIITAHRGADTDPIVRALGWSAAAFLDKQGIAPELLRRKVLEAYTEYLREAGGHD
jgi:DNA-binding NtrC family response regulator